jgi:Phasin protein
MFSYISDNQICGGWIMTGRTGENAGNREAGLGQFLQFGKEQTDALMSLQKELSDAYEQLASRWASRVKSEVELWSELGKKMTASRSVPEGLDACRDGVAQRLQMAAEDGHRLFEDGQKVIEAITRSLSNGWSNPKPGK